MKKRAACLAHGGTHVGGKGHPGASVLMWEAVAKPIAVGGPMSLPASARETPAGLGLAGTQIGILAGGASVGVLLVAETSLSLLEAAEPLAVEGSVPVLPYAMELWTKAVTAHEALPRFVQTRC